jgi:protein-S-isoprenylcysteine O-methyltransferase Ste14
VKRLRNILIVAVVFLTVFAAIVFAPTPVAIILWLACLFVLIGSVIRLWTLWSAR